MYAVIDTETTGLLPSHRHRVIEIAVVLLDARGQVEDEWVTLLNPQRDLGPQHIHGILTADVLDAPEFDDVARGWVSCWPGGWWSGTTSSSTSGSCGPSSLGWGSWCR